MILCNLPESDQFYYFNFEVKIAKEISKDQKKNLKSWAEDAEFLNKLI
jgi:hypothetical protein